MVTEMHLNQKGPLESVTKHARQKDQQLPKKVGFEEEIYDHRK